MENTITTHVDYLRGTTPFSLNDTLDLITMMFEDSYCEVLPVANHGYQTALCVNGIIIYDSPHDHMPVCIEASGKVCQSLGYHKLSELYNTTNLRASRIDLAVDHHSVTPSMCRDAWMNNKVRTRVKSSKTAKPGREDIRNCDWYSNPDGDTFAMGSRGSSKYMRCYDQHGFNRLELECKAQYAQVVAATLFSQDFEPENMLNFVIGCIKSFVEFVEPGANSHQDTPLTWWADFCDTANKVVLHLPKKAMKTIEDLTNYVIHQVAPTLAALEKVYGQLGMLQIISDARYRITKRNRHLVKQYQVQRVQDMYYGIKPRYAAI